MAKLRSTDDLMKEYLLGTQNQAKEIARDARIEASDPGYLSQPSIRQRDAYREEGSHLSDVLQVDKGRDLGEHLQDIGVGLMGTFGAIGNTAILGVAAAGDGLERLVTGESDWEATQQALKDMNSTSEYWNSLQSEKSKAFDRISQYRQDKAIETAGQDADFIDRLTAGFSAAAGAYIDNPDQILTDGVAQLPYLLTGGVAKAATTGTGVMSPLVARLAQKMSVESAEKLVQMGIVGGLQGTIEGADAASSTYARVMNSTDTFGPGQEGEKEAAALKAAAEAFGIAGATSAITGTLASKFELSPFAAKGGSAVARTGDNIVKALQEGVQETIESGTSQFATNLAGNEVLKGKDLVALDQGVGGAAGTGFVVGMGSTAVTNPRSVVDAALTPLTLAGKAFSYVGDRAVATERREDMAAAQTQADEIVANITTPAAMAAMNQGTQPDLKTQQQEVLKTLSKMYDELDMKYGKNHFMDDDLQENPEYVAAREAVYQKSEENRVLSDQLNIKNQTVDTPAEEVILPPEIDTRTQVGLFATGMEYLRGKSMDSDDAVSAFHVLGSVLAAANNIRSLRDGAAADAADTTLPQTDRDKATKALSQLDAIMDNDQLNKWVADFPMEDIESELEDLKKTPEAFGSVIAHLAAMNPLKMTDKIIDTALEAKSLPKAQRDSLLLAQELKAAEAELKVGTDPDSSEVSRSIMQTGFPGASDSKQSIADMLRNVTTALAQNDPESAQSYFSKLTAFSTYLTDRAGRFDQALKDMNASGEKAIDVPDTRTWVDGKLTDIPFRLIQGNANSLGVRIAVRKDAEAVAKMVAAMQKRTGLNVVTAPPKAAAKPTAAPAAKPAATTPTKPAKPAAAAPTKPAAVVTPAAEISEEEAAIRAMTDEALNAEADALYSAIQKRKKNDTAKAVEQDIRYNNLVHEQARRMREPKKPAAKPTGAAAATDVTESLGEQLAKEMLAASKNPYARKDAAKARRATAFIGVGRAGSSTSLYRKLAEKLGMIKDKFTADDVIFISANGAKTEQGDRVRVTENGVLTPEYAALDEAIAAGATILTDNETDRKRSYNKGEREIAAYLESKGYKTGQIGNVWKPGSKTAAAAATDENTSRITPEQAARLSPEGLAERIEAITKKGIQNTTKQDDATLAVLQAEVTRREEVAAAAAAAAADEAAAESPTEPSKNHFTGLQPSYPVADGASVAEQNDAKNHLSQSFTPSGKPGLVSKGMDVLTQKQALLDELGVNDNEEATQTVLSTMGLVQTLFVRMNELLKTKHSPVTVKTFLKGRNSWRLRDARYLYATIWGNEGQIKYQKNIATVMAWTGVQHMLDMVIPVSWSNDAVQKFVKTYGEDIQEMLADGWIPLPEQMHDIAKKLRINLELKADPKISPTYTDGTMLALAGNIVEAMLNRPDFNGVMDHRTMHLLDKEGNKSKIQVQWVKMNIGNKDLLFDTARLFDKFFVEDGPKGLAHIAKPPTNVNPFYRNSLQKIGKEQSAALEKMNNTWYKLSPLMYGMWNALPTADHAWRLFGMRPVVVPEGEKPSLAQIEQKGANNTLWADLKTIAGHIKRLEDHVAAQEEETDIHDVKSFFEHEQIVNGRASPKGISVQSSKAYREFTAVAQYTVDPTKENKGFRMAVAQGLGIKMDVQAIEDSLDKLDILLADSRIKRALEAALRMGNGHPYAAKEDDLLEADLQAMEALSDPEGLGIELSPHAIAALLHQAKYQEAKGKGETFTSSLMYEIDGKTDGPINLMMLMGLRGSLEEMTPFLGLAGLFFADSPTAVQDMTQQLKDWHKGSKDLYEMMAANAAEITNGNRQEMLDNILEHTDPKYHANTTYGTKELMRSITYLLNLANLSNSNVASILADYKRAFTKKPAQAAGYLQEILSVSGDLLNTMLVELSKLHDSSKLEEADYAHIDKFFSSAFGSSEGKIYYNGKPSAYAGLEWAGKPLTRAQWNTARATLTQFGAGGLFGGVVKTIGYQRAQMEAAAAVMNQRVAFAQHVLRKMYLQKQEAEVKAGNLLPNQPLPKITESAIVDEVWKTVIPHPMLRNTAGLPVAKIVRGIGNELLGSTERDKDGRIQNNFFVDSKGNPEFRQYTDPVEAAIQDLGVSFAALSIMAAGDGSMMTGYFSKTKRNVQNMFDGMYMNPEEIDDVGFEINGEVKKNWEHDFIGAILDSVQAVDKDDFRAWLEPQKDGKLYANYLSNLKGLARQRDNQTRLRKEINAKDHYISHMASHGNPSKTVGTPLNSTTLGTSVTDPLLDLAADELGHEINGIRKMSAADIKSLLNNHTFENPLLKGLWNVLAPLVSNNLVLYMSSDKQGLADFYQQNERREMGSDVNGISIGDRVYVRTINAETIVHELLHATTKNLTATFFANPASLTPQQQEAMKNLKTLMMEFAVLDTTELSLHQRAMAEHVQSVMNGYFLKGDTNAAMQEFLAYSLSNFQMQRTLGSTKSKLGTFFTSVFNAMKKLFGFPNGTQSDSMLAHLFSNFEALTEQAVDRVYPISPETALESVNPSLARSFGEVLSRLEKRSATVAKSLGARVDGVTRMQELAKTGLFPTMTSDQLSAGAYLQAMFAVGLQLKAADNALLARVVDAVRDEGPKAFGTDPVLAQARYDFFFENNSNKHDRAADILALGLVNPEFAKYMEQIVLPKQQIDKRGLNNWLDSLAKSVYELMDTGLILKGNATLGDALEVATLRIRQSMLQSIKRQETKPGAYRRLTEKLSEGVHLIGEKAGKQADARLQANQTWIGTGLMLVAGIANTSYADRVGKLVLSYSNHMDGMNPAREVIQELVGTNGDNFKLIQLKGIAARMISAIRQNFREQTPVTVKSWFKDLSPEQDALLHTVIGKFATYSLSQNLKDRMEELLTDPTNARADAELLLMSGGNRTKRLLMIKHAKRLGDRMANQGNQALYLNTRAIAGLAVEGGGDALTDAEFAALENLSTLQALSHLTPTQRRQTLALYRDNTEGFWKATALIDSFFQFDTQRAGKNTATLNMQKGWIPVEADGRKKLKLFQKSEVRKAERMGWVQVGEFKDDPNLVYMATTIGKTPTLSGGAIHAVDFHMNGIHYHSGMPTDPSIQTIITHPKAMADIQRRILNGEVMPYTALYDAAGDVDGFQRLLDPAMVERHTKTVGRLSDAAGIWLGRLHEERVAHGQNQVAADLLAKTWEEGKKDKREKEFVNIRNADKIIGNVWETLPYHTKVQLENVFADGSKNPPIMIRRDQLNDAIGYHKASVSNFFTGDNRYEKSTNDNVAALSRQILGKNAYKYLLTAEEGWQALIGSAKDTIIVKSLVVALNNLASNQTQLYMITGNPIWNLRVQSQKHKELVSYLGYQQRIARLKAEELSTADPKAIARVNAEQTFLKNEMRKLSIYPLIEAGEMPTIAEGLSETEEFSLVGDFTAWAEKQMGKMPPVVGTIINNLAVSKETSLYKGLDRMVQYGDFVAKATMYEWLTTQDKAAKTEALELMKNDKTLKWADAIHTVALMEVNDEFVNYARLPGRWRTYGEDMGLLWFYNYKIRIMKMAFRRMRKNPAAFLIGAELGSALGVATLWDTLPQNINFAYSTGLDPLFSAHETILWNQMF
jgi:hypothetical protein